ncbi:hypothetical protein L226DRAFT_532688 [Lentinus tigrinus ALCF2SS1-7]|uniref:BTB domain-containing protein n=1 Tax=Lentinus tigrinus ALCF2SS1-6 TaxID=1328759 RepID=A0A5C2SEP1_9APHY|nr:hypothetical protein L227DRAFT_573494 [Lentinus tigrinus ALCF2SS1-6]RPD77935.1 hypothetical protein L226DRAFT_532688 [Lentinus tigrinus ALCF2SS1-7]
MDHDQPALPPDSPLMTMTNSFLNDGMLLLSMPGHTRDGTYYIHDGNTVLLVEKTLFKVHRSVLTKDKSAFETMFQLSSETDSARSDSSMNTAQEGESDDNPIRLQGDTADEFRALLWALYALPHELTIAMTADADCTQLLNLVRITHKYQFRSIMTWALSALHHYYSRPGAFDDIITTNSSTSAGPLPATNPPTLPHTGGLASSSQPPTLEQLTELAALCERGDLLEATLTRWKRLIGEGRDLALAIAIGERFNLRPIVGLAYHALMLRGKAAWDAERSLTRAQRVRLLAGYYALTKLWDALPSQPPPLTHTARCTSQQRCTKAWGALWRTVLETGTQVMPGLAREDVLGKIMLAESMMKALVEREIPSQGFLDGMPHCRESALVATSMRVREIKEGLADCFSDDF